MSCRVDSSWYTSSAGAASGLFKIIIKTIPFFSEYVYNKKFDIVFSLNAKDSTICPC